MIRALAKEVLAFDERYRLQRYALTEHNLMYWAVALGGEAGEVMNLVKKIVRSGLLPMQADGRLADAGEQELVLAQALDDLATELVDIGIYWVELVNLLQIDFDKVWDRKHHELRARYTPEERGKLLAHGADNLHLLTPTEGGKDSDPDRDGS